MLFREEDEELDVLPFADRAEAGRVLASKLLTYAGRDDAIVLGLPRGGVVVAFAVAGALHLPLDLFLVSKIGTPWNQELAMGALAEGGLQLLDLSIVKALCISDENIEQMTKVAQEELNRLDELYRVGRPRAEFDGKTVIVVDDGIATGCSILAAITAIRKRHPARLVVAVPVAPAIGHSAIRMQADEVISVAEPESFWAVSQWYENFDQVSDEDVRDLLRSAALVLPHAA